MNYRDYFKKIEENSRYKETELEFKAILDLADDILRLRLEKGWSQAELAERAGTKQANISRLESGLSNPSLGFLQKIAKALDTKLIVSFEIINAQEIYIGTEAKNQTQEAYLVKNWPKSKMYNFFDYSSPKQENL